MATSETQQLDEIIVNSRRKMLALGGAALAGLAFAGVKAAQAQSTPAYTDSDILNFALNLEYLESQFYTLATAGMTIDQLGVGIGAGTSNHGRRFGHHQAGRPDRLPRALDHPCDSGLCDGNGQRRAQSRHFPAQRVGSPLP